MRFLFIFFSIIFCSITVSAQSKKLDIHTPDPNKEIKTVEAACGECQFKLKGKSCDLAVRIDGKSYFVEGTKIDDHGDAHAKEGFCNAVSKAEVQGEIKGDRFVATYFKLVEPAAAKKKARKAK